MNYDDEMLKRINEEADLYAYVSQFLELEKRGDNYFANCPLHVDVTPSLSFTPAKNSYYCFSCGKSGGMIGYLIDFEGLTFEDAVNKAARLAKVDLSKMCKSKTMTFLKRYKTIQNQQKEVYQHEILPSSILDKYKKCKIQEWLDEGIEQEVMDLFGVRVDDYGNRIIYPVYDVEGNLINIKGRTRYKNYKKMKLAKYINYYTVGVMDYFQVLETTLPYIQEENEIIIFESIKSVMKAYGWGYKNCVSAEKHTLTQEQINLLIKLRVNVVFAYDSDVQYTKDEVREDIDKLRRLTNVYIVEDRQKLLGGAIAKNSPVDCGLDVWEELYFNKRKVV
ncbi:MAG: toprim domain-containing protein [Bacteroidales bacterium]|nr:toprim domain-containing protein [Bacteroidales bacterium]